MVETRERVVPNRIIRVFAFIALIAGSVSVVAHLILTEYSEAFIRTPGPIWAGMFLYYTRRG